jgi:CheY-like chemotaxis protein
MTKMANRKKIMVVEDESIIALDIKSVLNGFGFDVCAIASSGEESIKLAKKTNPDLILMDVKLKGEMNGITAAKTIKKTLNIPVIYLSAYGDLDTINRTNGSSPFGLISKPFGEEELQSTIRKTFSQIKKFSYTN